ncbi:hypothetical protein [Micromonospora deserti]|uniref:hypothetical protein n=1 Tax=Micromonospora deserti TaxID=2070366 RepID=UPI0011B731C3|nr:hypothetical protein [Micromonospora deserti]
MDVVVLAAPCHHQGMSGAELYSASTFRLKVANDLEIRPIIHFEPEEYQVSPEDFVYDFRGAEWLKLCEIMPAIRELGTPRIGGESLNRFSRFATPEEYSDALVASIAVETSAQLFRVGEDVIGRIVLEYLIYGLTESMEDEEFEFRIAGMLDRWGFSILSHLPAGEGWSVALHIPGDYLTLADLSRFVDELCTVAFIPVPVGGDLRSRQIARGLLLAGRPEALVGMAECAWMDAKSQGYDLDSEIGRIELARDVARFANSEAGGFVALGLRTRRRGGRDVIVKTSLLEPDDRTPERYRSVIDARVYPAVRGLFIEQILVGDRAAIIIDVPSQAEHDKPFLVHGAIVEGRAEGSFISIVRRRGEESINIAPAAIHAMLVSGRRALEGSAAETGSTLER